MKLLSKYITMKNKKNKDKIQGQLLFIKSFKSHYELLPILLQIAHELEI